MKNNKLIKKYKDIIVVNGEHNIDEESNNSLFICVISHTETSEIPGITAAGANKDLIKYTPVADAEFLYYGKCNCINGIPATPDGKPTPAIITKTMLNIGNIPFIVVDAGVKVKPDIPMVSFDLKSGYNISKGIAMESKEVEKAYRYGLIIGKQLSKSNDLIILGESIPGGTTTALGVMLSLGVDAENKISSSMSKNPHNLKNTIVRQSMKDNNITFGSLKDKPFDAISLLGDPMIPSVTGIAQGAIESGGKVMLAGGTQMCAILSILKSLNVKTNNISIGTTKYILNDQTADFKNLVLSIDNNVGIFVVDLHLIESTKQGLKAFANGFVKEGVGAGGVSIATMIKQKGKINGKILLKYIEREYEKNIEEKLYIKPN
ncbi:MAG TPA: TIGR00303 family protein [Nitrososphaeraceae archaeon]|nr:TIGR00303 family protein [Nitrososphaeraceae archaeon]